MSRIVLRLFGGFLLSRGDGEEIPVPLAKERGLLAYLALNPGKHLPRGHLAGLFWGDQSETKARHSLSQSLSSLCGRLGPAAAAVDRDRQAVTLRSDAVSLDIADFEALAASREPSDLRRAVEIYRPDLFADLELGEPAFDDWARARASACHDRAMRAGIGYLAGESEERDSAARIELAKRLLTFDPCSETVHRALIRIHVEAGQTAAALRQFEACRDALRDDLGIAPNPETARLVRGLAPATPAAIDDETAEAGSENPREIPSLVILPFANLDGDPEIGPIAAGLTDDITTGLTRFGALFVISRESAFAEELDRAESRVVCRRLGVRHLLRGSLRRAGPAFRVNLRLVDGESGRNVWAETYRLGEEELMDLPQEVIGKVVSRLAVWLERDFLARARRRPAASWSAYTHLLQGLDFHHRNWHGIHNTLRAIKHFERAIELDPDCSRAHAYLACASSWPWFKGRKREQLNPSLSMARRAVALDPEEVEAQRVLGGIHLVRGEHELSHSHFEEARQSHPGHAHVLAHFARYYTHDGAPREAIGLLSRARQLNPLHPPWYWEHLGIARFARHDYEAALQAFSRMSWHSFYDLLYAAAASAHLGRQRHAESRLREALEKRPGLRLSSIAYFLPYRQREDLDHVLDGLRRAGLPD